jgi:hypothetical protein
LPARPPRSRPAWTGRTRGRGGRVERQPGRNARSGPDPPGAHLRAGAIGHRPCRARRRLQARGGHRGGPHARAACLPLDRDLDQRQRHFTNSLPGLPLTGRSAPRSSGRKSRRWASCCRSRASTLSGRCRPCASDDLILRRRGGRLAGRGGRAGAYRLFSPGRRPLPASKGPAWSRRGRTERARVCGLSLGAEGWMPRAQGLEGVEHRLR